MSPEEISAEMRERMQSIAQRMLASHIQQFLAFENTPWRKAQRAKWLAEWKAKPWYVRAWIVSRGRIRGYRERLGEVIAGREFE